MTVIISTDDHNHEDPFSSPVALYILDIKSNNAMKTRILIFMVLATLSLGRAQTWAPVSVNGTTHDIQSIWWDASNPNYGIVTGYYWFGFDAYPFDFQTSDGGSTWTYQQTEIGLNGVYWRSQKAYFSSSTTGYLAGGGLIKTNDGGATWNTMIDAAGVQLSDMIHSNANNGYAVGEEYGSPFQGVMYKTTNGWNAWSSRFITSSSSTVSTVTSLERPSSAVMYAGALSGGCCPLDNTMFKSTDDGETWAELVFTDDVLCLSFINDLLGYLGTTTGIFKTTDGGISWSQVLSTSGSVKAISMLNGLGFAVCSNGYIYSTVNNGDTWVSMGQPAGAVSLNDVFFVNSTLAYAAGNDGTLLQFTGDIPLSIDLIDFHLHLKKAVDQLDWIASAEINNEGFLIQQSRNKIDWDSIGFEKSIAYSGEPNQYSFINNQVIPGTTYYRLDAIDTDGEINTSAILAANRNIFSTSISFYPNPVKDYITVDGVYDHLLITITDNLGKTIKSVFVDSALPIDLSALTQGMYTITFIQDGNLQSQKLIKI